MKTILVIDSSVNGSDGVSRQLVQDALQELTNAHPGSRIIYHDLGKQPIPHLVEATAGGIVGAPGTAEESAARARSDALIAELREADILLIGAPMYNFSIPTTLRAWFDHVLRAGETFSYSAAGPKGLMEGKQAIVIESRGGFYSDGPARAIDFQEPYLRHLLGFMGITDVSFVHAEKVGFGPEARAAALVDARAVLADLAGADEARAA